MLNAWIKMVLIWLIIYRTWFLKLAKPLEPFISLPLIHWAFVGFYFGELNRLKIGPIIKFHSRTTFYFWPCSWIQESHICLTTCHIGSISIFSDHQLTFLWAQGLFWFNFKKYKRITELILFQAIGASKFVKNSALLPNKIKLLNAL